jgi:ribosome recycling factor
MQEDVLREAEARMHKTIAALEHDLAIVRTGRATPALLDSIRVDYYGVPTPLNQIAGISAPEARLLVIQPWDRSTLPAVEKAILKSELGLTPSNDGNVIRLVVPILSEERRRDLVKMVRKRVEAGRVAVRNVRRDGVEQLRGLERDRQISADICQQAQERLQKLTDAFVVEVNKVGQAKEDDLLEV